MQKRENVVRRRILAGALAAAVGISCTAINFAGVVSAEDKQYGDGYRSSFKGNYQAGNVYYDIGELYGHAYYDNNWNDNASDENYARYGWQVYDVKSFLDEDGNGRDANGHIVNTIPFTTDINADTSDANQRELMCWQVYSSKEGTRYLERTDIPDFGAPTYAGEKTPAYYIAKGEVEQDGQDVYIKWTVRSWVKDSKTWIDPDVFNKSNLTGLSQALQSASTSDTVSVTTPDIETYFENFKNSTDNSVNTELGKMWDAAQFESTEDIAKPLDSKDDVDTWWDSVAANVYTAEVTYDGTINTDYDKYDYTTNIDVKNLTDILGKSYNDTISATVKADVDWTNNDGTYHNNDTAINVSQSPWYSVPNAISAGVVDDIIRNTKDSDLQTAISQQSGSLDSIVSPITSVREINPVSSEIGITSKQLADMFSETEPVDGKVTWNKETVKFYESTENGDEDCIFVRGDLMNVLKDKVDSDGRHYVENNNVSYESDKWYELFTVKPANGTNYYPYARSTEVFVDMIRTYANAETDSNGGDCWIFDDSEEQIAKRYDLDMTKDSADIKAIYNSVHDASVDYDPEEHMLTLSDLSYADNGYNTNTTTAHATNCPIVNVTTDLMNIQSTVFDEGTHKVKVSEKVRMTTGYQRAGGEIKARRVEEVPTIDTTATSMDHKSKDIKCSVDSVIYDKVVFTGLRDGETYTLKTEIYDKTDDKMLSDEIVKVDPVSFVPNNSNYTVDVKIDVDTTALKEHVLVIYETLYLGDKEIISETNADNEKQTVTVEKPDIKTVASDKSGAKFINAATDAVIIDKVSYSNLVANEKYTLKATITDVDTKEVLGTTAEQAFSAEKTDGTVTMTFPAIDTTKRQGHKLLVTEVLYSSTGKVIASHPDTLDDPDQTVTVKIPDITTSAQKQADSSSNETIQDTIEYKNLVPGKKYTVVIKLYDVTDGYENVSEDTVLNFSDGSRTAKYSFTASESGSGSEVISDAISFDTINLQGHDILVYEDLYEGDFENGAYILTHKAVDGTQTCTINTPYIETVATADVDGGKIVPSDTNAVIVDKISYSGFKANETYDIMTYIYDKTNDGETIYGPNKTQQVADSSKGEFTVSVQLDTTGYEGHELVVGEVVYVTAADGTKQEYVSHNDIEDVNQTVTVEIPVIPQISTTATSKATGSHTVENSSEAVIVDRVSYSGLEVGKEYTLTATAYDKSTGEALEGVDSVTKTFVADETGYVDVEVPVDTTLLAGQSIVMFESLAYNDIEIAVHNDINDDNQTVTVVRVGTKAVGSDGNKTLAYGQTVTVIDTVDFEGLTPGEAYVVKGQLVDRSDSSVVAEGETEFTADKANGSVQVRFTLDTTDKAKKTYVAFETLIQKNGDVIVGEHKDLNDADQTVTVDDKPVPPPPDEPSEPEESSPNPPQTGDESHGTFDGIIAGILFMAAIGCGMLIIFRKRLKDDMD